MSAVEPTQVCTERFILPDLGWSCLLGPISRDARPGAVLETHTEAMRDLIEQTLREIGRTDVTVEYRPGGPGNRT